MTEQHIRRGFTQVVVKNQVILNLIQDLQRLSFRFVNSVRGRFQIKFGMTSLFNNGGFTLIELLVVVLIIGILAAVALPQYQKAVAKSRFAALKPITKAVKDAQEIYFEEHGEYAQSVDDLDIQIPVEANVQMTSISDGSVSVLSSDERLENNAYVMVLAHSPSFANNTYCTFNEGDVAEGLCNAEGTLDEDASDAFGFEMYRISGNSGVGEDPVSNVPEGPKWNGTNMLQSTYDLMNNFYSLLDGDDFNDDNISVESGRLEYIDANTLKIKGELYTYDPVFNSITGPFGNHLRRVWYGEGTHSIGSAHSYDQGQTWEYCSGNCLF